MTTTFMTTMGINNEDKPLKKRIKRKANKKLKLPIQCHHIVYGENEKTVLMYKGEHFMITKLDRKFRLSIHKPFSLGFLEALVSFYHKYGNKAVDLNKPKFDTTDEG